jgi:hypothetical protein
VVEWDGLENRCTGHRTEGSNPSLSAEMIEACAWAVRNRSEVRAKVHEGMARMVAATSNISGLRRTSPLMVKDEKIRA